MTWNEYEVLWKPLIVKQYRANLEGSSNKLAKLLGLPKTFLTDHLLMSTNDPLPEDIRVLLETLNNSPW
jgi:hypothetical protein